jgi:hypothetical protein
MTLKYVYQHFQFFGTRKFTRIGIFGLKIYHLAAITEILFMSFSRVCDLPEGRGPGGKNVRQKPEENHR